MAGFVTTSASNEAFIQALVDIAEEAGTDASIRQIRDDALAKIAGGSGELGFVNSASLNGANAAQQLVMDPRDLLAFANEALRRYAGTAVSLTYTDFSGLR